METPKSMYNVSFEVKFDIGYKDGIRQKILEMFGAFNVYGLETKENRGK